MMMMGKCHVATRVGPTNDGFLPTGPNAHCTAILYNFVLFRRIV